MLDRPLGSTGLRIGPVAFGAGPIAQLLVGGQSDVRLETIRRAVELGVDWFDTAATYGGGESEANLGRALDELGLQSRVRVATKIRILPDELGDIAGAARRSIESSLGRLRLPRVTLLQIHNSITHRAGAEPTSITPEHVLGPGGLLAQMDEMRREGLVEHLGLTGLGEPGALRQVIASGAFATLQIPYNLLNASAGHAAPPGFAQTDYGNVIADCQARAMGVFAIRVFAGGALVGRAPSPHTFKTPFFPLDLYRRDEALAEQLAALLPPGMSRDEAAVRFVASHRAIASAIIGFATPEEVARAVGFAYRGALDADLLTRLTEFSWRT